MTHLLETDWYRVFYWFTVADNVKLITGILSVVFGIYFVIAVACALGATEDNWRSWEKGSKRVFFMFSSMFFICVFMWMLLPTKKDALIIITGGAVGNFVTKDSSSRAIPGDLTKFLHLYMKKEIEDLSSDTRAELGLQTPKETLVDKLKTLTKEEIIERLKNDTTLSINK